MPKPFHRALQLIELPFGDFALFHRFRAKISKRVGRNVEDDELVRSALAVYYAVQERMLAEDGWRLTMVNDELEQSFGIVVPLSTQGG